MKRLGIYFFFDKDGVVDDYVPYYLKHLKPFCSELCVVVNKPLGEKGQKILQAACDKLIVRANVGFDSGAYKEALESYGYGPLKQYDELLLCNFTCYGPVYPFGEMFDKMAKSDADFWGNCRFPRLENTRLCALQKTDYIPEHIMSYFMVIRHNMLVSDAFKNYWRTLQTATSYAEAIVVNELRFTQYFEQYGFKGDAFISKEISDTTSANADVFLPVKCLQARSPLVKRRVFFSEYGLILHNGRGLQARQALDYLQKNTDYDVNLIWENLLRTVPGSVLKRNLHLNYFLSETHFTGNKEALKRYRVALLCYIYYEDMVDYCADYAANLPPWADIFVITVNEAVKQKALAWFSKLPNRLEVRVKPNRGKLAAAVLITGKDIFENYDFVCVTQAKKSSGLRDTSAGEDFCQHCWQSVLQSAPYVLNVLQTFADNPRLGYACALPPHWDLFSLLPGNENTANKREMERVLRDVYHISVPWDDEPIASYGECYWVRGKAYKTLTSRRWTHDEFPQEPTAPDGTVLHALERLNPLFAQYDGFYPVWILPQSLVSVYLDNIYFYYRRFMTTNNALLLLPAFCENTQKDACRLTRLKIRYYKYKLLNLLTWRQVKKFSDRTQEVKNRIDKAQEFLAVAAWRKK